jgi:chromate transport protein ChrA
MSLTKAPPTAGVQLAPSTASRAVGAIASALLAVALFMTVASVDVPHDPSDAELLAWWQQSSNRMSGLISGLSAICAGVLFAVVINYIRSLSGTAKSPQWLAFARSMGAAVTALWLVTGAARATMGHLVDVMDEPLPGADVLRFATALN